MSGAKAIAMILGLFVGHVLSQCIGDGDFKTAIDRAYFQSIVVILIWAFD
jgi:xanthine/uracil permease